MGMQGKRENLQKLERISRGCLCGLLLISVAAAFLPIPELPVRIVSVVTSCLFLLGNVIRYRMEFGKHHAGLWCFCILCMSLMISCVVWPCMTLKICSVWVICGYYLTGRIIRQEGVRRQSIVFCLCSCCVITVSICSRHIVVTGLFMALQLVILLRFADPVLHRMATRHREKRVVKGEEINPAHVSLLRKVLFGQNGRLELPGVER